MEASLIEPVLTFFQNLSEGLIYVLGRLPSLLIKPAFIATFLFFTIVIWIGMSGADREPVSSFSRAGLIAFIATVFMFMVITE
ncbi:MAG: hypothetical protein V4628_05435 [Pseudomonadota bacterium]